MVRLNANKTAGNAVIELFVSLTLVSLLLVGLFQAAILVMTSIVAQHAANQAARAIAAADMPSRPLSFQRSVAREKVNQLLNPLPWRASSPRVLLFPDTLHCSVQVEQEIDLFFPGERFTFIKKCGKANRSAKHHAKIK